MSEYDNAIKVLRSAITNNEACMKTFKMNYKDRNETKERIAQLESAIKRLKEEG